ncbi:acetyl-CoA carboxylase biotin carboxyl carrier protein [Candidatus Bipolaricaulota bacterium]|nr:acetyl-CoA carboxylase biotin carboxyl carrier protein [Candidatus Bipolaricaulota bacterium]MBS3825367.1 acetyl-CoA carboxylase biotin carboxyl carrier protein [Candidatus Bipolaricaulota bacterium]
MDLNIEQMKEIIELFEDSNLTEISVSQNDYQVTLKKNSGSRRSSRMDNEIQHRVSEEQSEISDRKNQEKTPSELEGPSEDVEEKVTITSPIVGTFFRSPSPDDPPYVSVGDEVGEGDTVCIVEAMKVMNEVKANKDGEVVEVCVEDGDPVEYGQELFILMPSDKVS